LAALASPAERVDPCLYLVDTQLVETTLSETGNDLQAHDHFIGDVAARSEIGLHDLAPTQRYERTTEFTSSRTLTPKGRRVIRRQMCDTDPPGDGRQTA
jgi:hypothetical protein